MTTDTATKSPETLHDERLSELWTEQYRANHAVTSAEKVLERFTGSGNPIPSFMETNLQKAIERLDNVKRALAENMSGYTGWSRFWLVVSSPNGHIHSNTSCSTCRYDTRFNLLPELSGLSEDRAVEGYGSILCSVCFPTAPVAWTTGESKSVTTARAERESKRAEREAKRLEKALLPDGSPLKVQCGRYTERFDTLHSAKMWLTDAADYGTDHPSFPSDAVRTVAEAVAAKVGESVDTVLADAAKRAAKRR